MSELITAGLIGSLITIVAKALIDFALERNRNIRDLKKQVFQRKTDAVEKAMSWYQEALDCYSMLQIACDEIDKSGNSTTLKKLYTSASKANKLFKESEIRLNQIYLYYDFSEIEAKFNGYNSMQYINYGVSELGKLEQQAYHLNKSDNPDEFADLQKSAITIFRGMSKALDDQKCLIIAIQKQLRSEYKKFSI